MTGGTGGPSLHEQLSRRPRRTREEIRLMREYGEAVVSTCRILVASLGIDSADEVVARALMRAVLLARAGQGVHEGDPDVDGGPPLTDVERARILRRALRRLEGRGPAV